VLISEFYFEIKHIKGKENIIEYALSQSVQAIHFATTSVGYYDIKQRIKTLMQEDEFFNHVREGLQQETKERKYEGYHITFDELILYNNRLYVTNSTNLRHLIMGEFHRRPYVYHLGYQYMVTIVRKLYY